jgi:hypothetical protein
VADIEFLGLWEKLSNPDFKPIEFERFRNKATADPAGGSLQIDGLPRIKKTSRRVLFTIKEC